MDSEHIQDGQKSEIMNRKNVGKKDKTIIEGAQCEF